MKKNRDLIYGISSGLAVCAFVFVQYLLGYHSDKIGDSRIINYFGMLIPITFISIGIIQKKKAQEGWLELKDGMKTGILITFITGIITTVFMLIYNKYINPEFINVAMAYENKLLTEAGKKPEEIAAIIEQFKAGQALSAQLFSGLVGTPLMGMIPTLIITLILRKSRNQM